MNTIYDWRQLQLFGEGGASAGSGSAGTNGSTSGSVPMADANDGQQRLRELGVPEARLKRLAKRNAKRSGNGRGAREAVPSPVADQPAKEADTAVAADQEMKQNENDSRLKKGRAAEQVEASIPYHIGKQHLEHLRSQAEQMKAQYPDFDLDRELKNPRFLHLTGPVAGLSLEEAYMALHYREVDAMRNRIVAQGLRKELSEAIRAGSLRPRENGIGAKAAAVTAFDYKNASRSERAALKKQIYDAAARGEKIYPTGR